MIVFIKLFPVLIAAACIVKAILPEQHRTIRHPVITEGEIVSNVQQRVYRRGSEMQVFSPVVRYKTENDELTVTSRQFVPEWKYRWKQGDKVKICYEKSQPDMFFIYHDSYHEWMKMILLTIGIGTLIAYAILYVQYF